MNYDAQGEPNTIKQLFETAKQIGSILTALDASGASVVSPYSGFSVFVVAHINMYGTIVPHRYPGGLEGAEEEKRRNFAYLERLSKLWPVGRSWVSHPPQFLSSIPLTKYSGERFKKQIGSTRQSGVPKPTPNPGCIVPEDLHSPVLWMSMAIFALGQARTPREQQLPSRATPVARIAIVLHRLLVLKVGPTFLPETIPLLGMSLTRICSNGHSLMGRGRLDLMWDWMVCGLILVYLIRIRL